MKPLMRLLYHAYRLSWRVTRPMMVGVRVILIRERTILLVKHTYERHWYFPGGGVKRGETLEQAARREAREEVNAELGEMHLLGIYTSLQEYKSDHVTVFYCTDFTLAPKTDFEIEIEAFDFFAIEDLPKDISSGTARRVKEYLKEQNPAARVW